MIAIPIAEDSWKTISFPSTLYLYPILDLLLANIPPEWHAELRLGLQEALVNAAKHGNQLDPKKDIVVKFYVTEEEYSWIICDQGNGFISEYEQKNYARELPPDEAECGRGMCILYQIFDLVNWNSTGNELKLCKQVKKMRKPLLC